jgi:hypothetical protein
LVVHILDANKYLKYRLASITDFDDLVDEGSGLMTLATNRFNDFAKKKYDISN